MTLDTLIEESAKIAVEIRHKLHQIPELCYQEFKTAALIRQELDALDIDYIHNLPGVETATIALIGDQSKPCIAFRADIDALPIEEATGLAYKSTHPGLMHACGHDGHTAILLAVARVLKTIENDLPVCVKLIWQPAEEGGAGAERLVQAGVLDGRVGPKVLSIFGLHGWPSTPLGMVTTKPGPLLAATDNFVATFIGKSCHGAMPHKGVDPLATACEAVGNLQKIVSREIDPTDSAVITVGIFNAGTAANIIPEKASFTGTARTLTPSLRKEIRHALERHLQGIAQANNCSLSFEWQQGYPATINEHSMTEYVTRVASKLCPFIPFEKPIMGGEDFAYYLQKVPGCFFLIGLQPDPQVPYPPLHNDRFDFTDGAIKTGLLLFVHLAKNFSEASREQTVRHSQDSAPSLVDAFAKRL